MPPGEHQNGDTSNAGLLSTLSRAYADILRRQGRTTTPFVRWSATTKRSHEFTWLGGAETRERLMHGHGPLRIPSTSPLFDAVQKMHATAMLNPYEREVLYGYPYVIGRRDRETIRGPLLTLAVTIEVDGQGFAVSAADDVVHVNALPFKIDGDPQVHDQKIGRLIATTPELPFNADSLQAFVAAATREFPNVKLLDAALDGRLAVPPDEPRGTSDPSLWLGIYA